MKYRHRFTRPGKGEAYQTARAATEKLDDDHLSFQGWWHPYRHILAIVTEAHPDLPGRDAEHVSAKALRVERDVRTRERDLR